MTRTIRAPFAAALLTTALGSVGCVGTGTTGAGATGNGAGGGATIGDRWRNYVDPCYPERYNHAARQATLAPFAQQVYNGHVLNQTVFTYYFEYGTDKLTTAGMEKLDSIARTRPAPDPKLYIQAATSDVPLTDANAGQVAELRTDLDSRRAAAVQKYLATVPTFAPVNYEIFVHNTVTPGLPADSAAGAYRSSQQGYRGGLTGSSGAGALSTGGGAGGVLTAPSAAPAGAPAGPR